MNAWLLAAAALLAAGFGPCLWASCRGAAHERVTGLSLAGTVGCTVLLLLAQGFSRSSSYTDLALVLALLSPIGVLVFIRFVGGSSDEYGERR